MEKETTKYGNKSLQLTFYHTSAKVNVAEEYYIHTVNTLFGNIGGMLGLLLGTSALSLTDFMLAWMERWERSCGRSKK